MYFLHTTMRSYANSMKSNTSTGDRKRCISTSGDYTTMCTTKHFLWQPLKDILILLSQCIVFHFYERNSHCCTYIALPSTFAFANVLWRCLQGAAYQMLTQMGSRFWSREEMVHTAMHRCTYKWCI